MSNTIIVTVDFLNVSPPTHQVFDGPHCVVSAVSATVASNTTVTWELRPTHVPRPMRLSDTLVSSA